MNPNQLHCSGLRGTRIADSWLGGRSGQDRRRWSHTRPSKRHQPNELVRRSLSPTCPLGPAVVTSPTESHRTTLWDTAPGSQQIGPCLNGGGRAISSAITARTLLGIPARRMRSLNRGSERRKLNSASESTWVRSLGVVAYVLSNHSSALLRLPRAAYVKAIGYVCLLPFSFSHFVIASRALSRLPVFTYAIPAGGPLYRGI